MRRKFARFAWFVLAVQLVVILWGAFVRASKSGAGCGEHWPLCQGQVLPQAPQLPTIIEFTHRITSGIALVFVVLLVIWAFRAFPPGDIVRRMAGWSGFFILTESLIGAMLVLLGHTALNPSTARGFSLSVHLVNTLFLLAALSLTAWWAGADKLAGWQRELRTSLTVAAILFIAAGLVGAIAALGDTLFAPDSIRAGLHQDFSAAAHPFVRIRVFHPIVAVAAGLYLFALALRVIASRHQAPAARRFALAVAALVIVQFAAGLLNILLLVPIPMQMVHLFLADALWIAFILFAAETLRPTVRPLR